MDYLRMGMGLKNLSHEIKGAIRQELDDWQELNKVDRMWQGDATLWTNKDESNWIGWLVVPILEISEVQRILSLAADIVQKDFQQIVLLGMGGSSLCPDVMTKTFGKIEDYPILQILDSTDPAQILKVEKNINFEKTLFIVSSKSGKTLEPNILKEYFYSRLQTKLGKQEVGDQFVAVTDPGTALEMMAKKDGFKDIFYGLPSIGGRYSALSNFGMLPSGLMGINIKKFLLQTEQMIGACLPAVSVHENPGANLGIHLGICAKYGKDKVTIVASPKLEFLGAWLEQLLAESTGKEGKGLIPVDREPLGSPEVYGKDRVFVYIGLVNDVDSDQDKLMSKLEHEGHIVIRLQLNSIEQLGAEFFRWEVATAVAGSVIGINPFDQPNVEGSKVRTIELTSQFEQGQNIPRPKQLAADSELQLFTDEKNLQTIQQHITAEAKLENYLAAYLNQIKLGDYVDISAFIENSNENFVLLQQIREIIRDAKKVATCLGFGPRFLHSTGQVYKGGPNTGVFLQLTAEYTDDIQVPGHKYTFGTVIAAQAQADFEVLSARSRRILQINLGKNISQSLQHLFELIRRAL